MSPDKSLTKYCVLHLHIIESLSFPINGSKEEWNADTIPTRAEKMDSNMHLLSLYEKNILPSVTHQFLTTAKHTTSLIPNLAEGFVTQIFPLSGGFNTLTVFSYKPLRYN